MRIALIWIHLRLSTVYYYYFFSEFPAYEFHESVFCMLSLRNRRSLFRRIPNLHQCLLGCRVFSCHRPFPANFYFHSSIVVRAAGSMYSATSKELKRNKNVSQEKMGFVSKVWKQKEIMSQSLSSMQTNNNMQKLPDKSFWIHLQD